MSRARLVITAVVVERRTHADVAAQYGLSRSWVARLVARYRAEGPAAFEARPRRPNTTPTAISPEVVELVVNLRSELAAQGLDAGPHTICWHLAQRHQITVSPATVRRRLVELGLVEANPKKRPRSSYTRFEADLPNECWQSDFCHWALADGSTVEVITWLDDCSRYALSVTAHRRITGPIAAATFDHTCADHGIPASTLTDNAMVYTTRLSGGRRPQRPGGPPGGPGRRPEERAVRWYASEIDAWLASRPRATGDHPTRKPQTVFGEPHSTGHCASRQVVAPDHSSPQTPAEDPVNLLGCCAG